MVDRCRHRTAPDPLPDGSGSFGVPRALVALAAQVIQARDPDRFDLLYRLVWRAQAGEPVLEQRDDPELTRARHLALAVRAEAHRMRTHLRFLAVPDTNATPPGPTPPDPRHPGPRCISAGTRQRISCWKRTPSSSPTASPSSTSPS